MFTHGPLARRASWTRRLAVCLTLVLAAPPLTGLLPAARAQDAPPSVPIKSLLLFPAASTAGDPASALSPRLDDAIKLRLTLVGAYKASSYTKFLPSVQRALNEGDVSTGLTDADIKAPFGTADLARAHKVAAIVGTDAFLLTTITSYGQDPASRRVTLLINSRVYDSQTGDPVPGLGGVFSGVAGPTSASDTDADIQQGAINDAAARVAASLNAAAPRQPVLVEASSQRGRSHTGEYVLGAILVGALLYAIISGSHFGGGGGGGGSSSSSSSGNSGGGPPAPPGGGGTTTAPSPGGPPAPPSG